jgi:hypothetical protein
MGETQIANALAGDEIQKTTKVTTGAALLSAEHGVQILTRKEKSSSDAQGRLECNRCMRDDLFVLRDVIHELHCSSIDTTKVPEGSDMDQKENHVEEFKREDV